mmetsp:Transcript_293/g.723  ORF Transcript_293/g.723 Transcript_293/m.723 type:complete len:274 (+) Transcript_293:1780-2601(+)
MYKFFCFRWAHFIQYQFVASLVHGVPQLVCDVESRRLLRIEAERVQVTLICLGDHSPDFVLASHLVSCRPVDLGDVSEETQLVLHPMLLLAELLCSIHVLVFRLNKASLQLVSLDLQLLDVFLHGLGLGLRFRELSLEFVVLVPLLLLVLRHEVLPLPLESFHLLLKLLDGLLRTRILLLAQHAQLPVPLQYVIHLVHVVVQREVPNERVHDLYILPRHGRHIRKSYHPLSPTKNKNSLPPCALALALLLLVALVLVLVHHAFPRRFLDVRIL